MGNTLDRYELDITDEYGFILHERVIPAGTRYPLHWHEFLEFEIIESGTAEHIYNGKTYVVEPGDAYMMCYYDFHEVTAITDVKLYSIHFGKNMLDAEIGQYLDLNKFHCHFEEKEAGQIILRMLELKEETKNCRLFSRQIIENIISEIVIAMIRKSTVTQISAAPLPVQQAIAYLNEHFLEKITLDELACRLSFSPNYLGHLFKTQIGCTFNDYLNTLRLKYACSLLLSSAISVKEIAYISGYSSVEYFMYAFKKKMHMTPGEYRTQLATSDISDYNSMSSSFRFGT